MMESKPPVRTGACDRCKRPGVQAGQCCRLMYIGLAPLLTDEDRDWATWASYHEGVELVGNTLVLHSKCRWLTPEGDCVDYENRPDLCKNWPEALGDLEFVVGCAYRFERSGERVKEGRW